MSNAKRILSVGFRPDVVPQASRDEIATGKAPDGADGIRDGLANAARELEALGYAVDFCFLTNDANDESRLREALARTTYDCVCIGAGVRLRPQHTEALEMVVNVLRQEAPSASICFNVNPADTVNAVRRWA